MRLPSGIGFSRMGIACSSSKYVGRIIGFDVPWHKISDPNDNELDELAKQYNLHPLHIEDCRNGRQRVKLEDRPNYIFIVLKPVDHTKEGELTFSDLYLFVGREFCITVAPGRCKSTQEAMSSAGRLADPERPDQIFYRIFDAIVDSYLPALDRIGDGIDELEDMVLDNPSPDALQEIFRLKRSLVDLRRVLVNTRDVGIHLQRDPGELLAADLAPFFRDIYDHIARSVDWAETQRDLLNGTLDVYLSSVANRTNNVMKVLTVLSTFALPSLVISGIYGMNLKGVPFLNAPYGFWIIGGMMVASTVALLGLLKKFGWF
jgi:magnesium transporter